MSTAAHQRSTRERLGRLVGIGKPHAQAPPVVDQCRDPGHGSTTLDVLDGKAGPPPVVLQLFEAVFSTGSFTVELGQADYLIIHAGHKYRVFADRDVSRELGKTRLFQLSTGSAR